MEIEQIINNEKQLKSALDFALSKNIVSEEDLGKISDDGDAIRIIIDQAIIAGWKPVEIDWDVFENQHHAKCEDNF